MAKGYLKPEIKCYGTVAVSETIGPAQTQYVGPTLYFQEAGVNDTSVPAEYSQATPQAQPTIYKIV